MQKIKIIEAIKQEQIDKITLAAKESELLKDRPNADAVLRREIEAKVRKEIQKELKTSVVTDIVPK